MTARLEVVSKQRMLKMPWLKNRAARVAAVILLGGVGLSACATQDYVDQQIAGVNSRIDQLDARVATATQRADQANQAAQAANSAAQGAATDARTANQRIDQLEGRVNTMQSAPARTPRG
ncbi:MAG TPA: Lpp/OprI family alanine-zipper lipoprotein [Hyphomonadaceae bacterium]|nr:Lpp/OprI family alanine-zipper lipoprotein [Hyphomonadaceae bacterium]